VKKENFISSILKLFYPDLCLTCQANLVKNEMLICTSCRHSLPLTDFVDLPNNLLELALKGRVPYVAATALLYYKKGGNVQSLIHALKYKNRQEVGAFFAKWMAMELKKSKRFLTIDGIVMVPLHRQRLKERGYNQLSIFSTVLSDELGIPVYESVLIKVSQSSSQTKKSRFSRFEKMNERFHLVDVSLLNGKHVLLVDDVFTTGATIEACANEILKTPNCKISVATMVITEHF